MADRTGASQRLPAPAGVLIDRGRPLSFTFDGQRVDAFEGDTIASALVASGLWLMSRSFKYHRPRGPVSLVGHEANTLVQVGSEPNVAADLRRVAEGDVVLPLNVVGRLERDPAAVLGKLSRFLPVGFYYRDFFGPGGVWDRWEPRIRALAGLGRAAPADPRRRFDQRFVHADVAVVGGGPAGLAAAAAAARAGADVVLFEQGPRLGGSLLWSRLAVDAQADAQARASRLAALSLPPQVRVFTDATVTGVFEDGLLSVVSGDSLLKVRARRIVMAHGGIEQSPVFPNNDLPGIAQPGGLQRLIRLYGVQPGRCAVVIASDDAAYGAALDLCDAGVQVLAVADLRGDVAGPEPMRAALECAGARLIGHVAALHAEPARGGLHLGGLRLQCEGGAHEHFAIDLLAASAGTVPAFNLAAQGGAAVRYEPSLRNFAVEARSAGLQVAGLLAGLADLDEAIDHATEVGRRAAETGGADAGAAVVAVPRQREVLPAWPIFESASGKAFVDLDEDLQPADLRETVRLGYTDMQLLKRFSTVGMGPTQGRHSALATLRLLARASGTEQATVGLATPRPPAGEETVAHLATGPEHAVRCTALHDRLLELGAVMMPVGAWLRPACFPAGRPGEPREAREEAVAREVAAVRQRAGLFDVGTLGGLLVRGPDAAALLDRLCTGRMSTLKPGGVRYALMLDEVGSVYDDGVAACLAPEVYYVTTSTGHSDAIFRAMLKWNALWRLDVDVSNVTTAYSGVNLAGPASRAILSSLCPGEDLSHAAFGYMRNRRLEIAGVPVIAMRVGFLGELAYELHLPASRALGVVDRLLKAGGPHGLVPIGVEAQRLLRLEKGHVIVGQDTDAVSTPAEVGLGWAVAADKPFFIGQRALRSRAAQAPTRALVCWQGPPGAPWPVAEGHLVLRGEEIVGHVTSVGRSQTLGRTLGMAFAAPESATPGSVITLKGEGGVRLQAEVVAAPFYDPAGERQKT